jgi:hypothetical protein
MREGFIKRKGGYILNSCKNCNLYKKVKGFKGKWKIYFCYPEQKGVKDVNTHICKRWQCKDFTDLFNVLLNK